MKSRSHCNSVHLEKYWVSALVLVTLTAILLGACTAASPEVTPNPTLEVPTEAPAATEIPPTEPPSPTIPPELPTAEPTLTTPALTLETPIVEGNGVALTLPPPAEGAPGLVANTNVNVRSGPDTRYAVYGVLLEGAAATITGTSPDGLWWAVHYPGAPLQRGWVSTEFVAAENTTGVPVFLPPPIPPTLVFTSPPSNSTPQGRIVDSIYLRSGPGEEYTAYGVIPANKNATIIGRNPVGDWWAVRINSNLVPTQHGWVPAAYVRARGASRIPLNPIQPAPEYADLPFPAEGAPAAYPMTPVYLRSGPGLEYPVLGITSPATVGGVTGISPNGEWWQVQVPGEVSLDGQAWVTAPLIYSINTGEVPVVEPPAPPKPVQSILPSAGDPSILTLETVNFFAGPGNEWPLLGVLPANAQAIVLGVSPDSKWYIVRIPRAADPGGRGWVSAELVEADMKRGVPVIEPPPK